MSTSGHPLGGLGVNCTTSTVSVEERSTPRVKPEISATGSGRNCRQDIRVAHQDDRFSTVLRLDLGDRLSHPHKDVVDAIARRAVVGLVGSIRRVECIRFVYQRDDEARIPTIEHAEAARREE
eukprot:scaffold100706_cov31-Tisochrysis_lutea.AAC.4